MKKNNSSLALVTAVFSPLRGGMSTVAAAEARALVQIGQNVCVYTLRARGKKTRQVVDGDFVVKRLWGWPRISYGGFVPQLFWFLRHHAVVYAELPAYGFMLPLLLWKIIRRGRLLVTVHMDPIGQGWRRWAFWLERFVLLRLIKKADAVRVSNPDFLTSRLIIDSGCTADKLKVIPFGVDLKKFRPRANWEQKNQPFIFLFVGRLARTHYFKGVDLLLRAFQAVTRVGGDIDSGEKIKNIRLLLVGDGELRSRYETQARALGIASAVEFLGEITDEELPDVYQRAHVLVLPSIDSSETFGLVLLEAMAAGLPVIASRLPGVASVLGSGADAAGELIEPGEINDLKRVLLSAVRDEALWQNYARVARQRAEQYGNWENIALQLEKLLY